MTALILRLRSVPTEFISDKTDLSPEYARKILGENSIIGFSTHNLKQAAAAIKLPIDYLAIGPVFSTKTKENPDEVVGIEGVKNVRETD